MTKAAGYVRVSTQDQAKEGESVFTQRRAIADYAKSQGWSLVEIYSDAGISGSSADKRLGLQSMLRDAEQAKFDYLIIHRLSRLGRNARDLLNHVDQLDACKVRLVSLKEQIDLSSPYGRALFTMLSAIAQLEREIIVEQSTENRVGRGKKGTPTAGTLPFARSFSR
jgi:site-specific DNA recombinase